MNHIGGTLDYSVLAKLHRPTDPETLGREARALAAIGFTPRDIADAPDLAPAAVSALLATTQENANG
jgi:hypothetical protein